MPKSKLLKLKNKPFWIVTAIILLIGVTFYSQTQRPKEGFETMYNYVGDLYYGTLSDISGVTGVFSSILDASSGDTVWKTGNSAPKSTDSKLYIINALTAVSLSKDDVVKREKDDIKNLKGVVYGVIKDSSGNYVDKDGNKIIGNFTNFLGMTILKTTSYWIMGGIGILVAILIYMFMRSSSSSGNNGSRYNP
jgi:hypothetical protein